MSLSLSAYPISAPGKLSRFTGCEGMSYKFRITPIVVNSPNFPESVELEGSYPTVTVLFEQMYPGVSVYHLSQL